MQRFPISKKHKGMLSGKAQTARVNEQSRRGHRCSGCESNKFHVGPPLWWMIATSRVQSYIRLFSLQSLLVGYVSLGIGLGNQLHFRSANSFKCFFVNKHIFYKGHTQEIYREANFQEKKKKKKKKYLWNIGKISSFNWIYFSPLG